MFDKESQRFIFYPQQAGVKVEGTEDTTEWRRMIHYGNP